MRKFLRLTMPTPDCNPLVREMFAIMLRDRVSVEELAKRSGYGETTIHRLRERAYGSSIRVFSDLLQVLGYELRIVRKYEKNQDVAA